MKFLYHLAITLFAVTGTASIGVTSEASEPSNYSKLLTPSPLGKDRILVLCLLNKSSSYRLNSFYESVNWDEFDDRELRIIEVLPRVVQSVIFENRTGLKGTVNKHRHHDYGDQIRQKAKCRASFDFVLIGKDMGVKGYWKQEIPQGELFQLIDAMPMRRFEMRQKLDKN